ncbi:MAG: nicotinate-nucleotide adenylyltransferase [Candidatus Omnitrophica bacterium]|nr:nicotinate-nucleotide adenylyltransferase [Candidatus Omnitrophota bacterium]HOX54195.1 nicotinate-nucleotide adenylyltransferase [Candidatus Omnitrophota bacterium]
MKRIGVFGGTFDPIHNGHITIAEEVFKELSLDKIIFVPAHIPPHKLHAKIASAQDRYNMVKLAVGYNDNFEVSDIEINREGPSYSIDTIKELKENIGTDSEFYFLIGSDSIAELKYWKDFNSLLKIVKFVVVNRPRYSFEGMPKGALRIQLRGIDISSSKIRNRIREKEPIDSLVPEKVKEYIIKKRLYKDEK